jgi:hypothetical protein
VNPHPAWHGGCNSGSGSRMNAHSGGSSGRGRMHALLQSAARAAARDEP